MYRCEATSVEGFIQQLAVCYVGRGYWFYVAGSVPEGKDPRIVDAKLIEKYDIDVSKWTRARRKRLGLGSVQYIRFDRFFVLLASGGEHPFFLEEPQIRDVRRYPIRFAGYSVSYRKGRDGTWHSSVRIDAVEFRLLKQQLLGISLMSTVDTLIRRFGLLRYATYAPVRNQYHELWRAINKRRRLGALEMLPRFIIPNHRRVVSPFGAPLKEVVGTSVGLARGKRRMEALGAHGGPSDGGFTELASSVPLEVVKKGPTRADGLRKQ